MPTRPARASSTPILSDEEITLARYRYGHDDSFDRAAGWLYEGMAKAFADNTARLAIVGDNPMLLSGEDPAKVARASKANSMAYQPALEKIVNFDTNWNIIAYPSPSWAKQVFPDVPEDVAVAKLADAIFAASRVDQDGAVAAWEKHNAVLRERTEWLNGQRFHALKYSGPGTDLTIGLADGHEWEGGASTAKNGITCNANIPTEEVFTTPHCRRVDGHVVSTKPLSYQGTLIDNIAVRFEDGRIVDAKASRGEEVLKKVLDTDEGARRLGEVALVPHSSPISKSGLLFFNTLFDENAASPHRARPVLFEMLRRRRQADPGADRGAGRQQEPDSYRLDDRLGRDRYRRHSRRRQQRAGIPQGRVGVRPALRRSESVELQPVKVRRGLGEHRRLLRLAVLRGEALEGVEDHLIAALAFVRRKIALEHASIGSEGLDAGLYIGPPRRGGLFRGRRLRPQMKVIAEQAHRKPAELDHDIGAFGDFLDRGLPDRKDLLAPAGVAADADRAAAMVEHDLRVRKGAGKIGEFADLRMKQPALETEVERGETGEPLAECCVEQQALRPRRIHAGDIGIGIPRRGMPDAAEAAVAGDDLRLQHRPWRRRRAAD